MGVVVRRYIDFLTIIITYLYSTCISSFFWQQHPYFFVHFKNVFRYLVFVKCNVSINFEQSRRMAQVFFRHNTLQMLEYLVLCIYTMFSSILNTIIVIY